MHDNEKINSPSEDEKSLPKFTQNEKSEETVDKENLIMTLSILYPVLSHYKDFEKVQATVQCFNPELDTILYNATRDMPSHTALDFTCMSYLALKLIQEPFRAIINRVLYKDIIKNKKETEIIKTILTLQPRCVIYGENRVATIKNIKPTEYGRDYILDKPIGVDIENVRNLLRLIKADLNKDIRLVQTGTQYRLTVIDNTYPERIYLDCDKVILDFKRLEFPLGQNIFRKIIAVDLDDIAKHILVAGGTGGGKSELEKLIIALCLLKEITHFLVDLKGGVEFAKYTDNKYCIGFGKNQKTGLFLLFHIYSIMKTRNEFFNAHGVQNYKEYVEKGVLYNWEVIQPIVVLIDEWTAFMELGNSMAKTILNFIMNQARSCNIIIITSLQHASKSNLSEGVKSNFANRVATRCNDEQSAEDILDKKHLEPYTELRTPLKGKQKGLVYIMTPDQYEEVKTFLVKQSDLNHLLKEKKRTEDIHFIEDYVAYAEAWYDKEIEPKLDSKGAKLDFTKCTIKVDIHGNLLDLPNASNKKETYSEVESKPYTSIESRKQNQPPSEKDDKSAPYKSKWEDRDVSIPKSYAKAAQSYVSVPGKEDYLNYFQSINLDTPESITELMQSIKPDEEIKDSELAVDKLLDSPIIENVPEQETLSAPQNSTIKTDKILENNSEKPITDSTKNTENTKFLKPLSTPSEIHEDLLKQPKPRKRV